VGGIRQRDCLLYDAESKDALPSDRTLATLDAKFVSHLGKTVIQLTVMKDFPSMIKEMGAISNWCSDSKPLHHAAQHVDRLLSETDGNYEAYRDWNSMGCSIGTNMHPREQVPVGVAFIPGRADLIVVITGHAIYVMHLGTMGMPLVYTLEGEFADAVGDEAWPDTPEYKMFGTLTAVKVSPCSKDVYHIYVTDGQHKRVTVLELTVTDGEEVVCEGVHSEYSATLMFSHHIGATPPGGETQPGMVEWDLGRKSWELEWSPWYVDGLATAPLAVLDVPRCGHQVAEVYEGI
jgi:hypothetical protein